ncbi:MAG: hypothetical protein H7328_11080 [Bdellovibrio sp.]|nr:hypothetical protein [Bdellovibrio sp.]
MKKLIFAVLFLSWACSNKPKPLNPDQHSAAYNTVGNAFLNFQTPDDQGQTFYNGSSSAISGRIFLKNTVSSIIPNAQLELFKWSKEKWVSVIKVSTNINGEFNVTHKLYPGKYELRTVSQKYQGILLIALDDKPIKDLIFEVSLKK